MCKKEQKNTKRYIFPRFQSQKEDGFVRKGVHGCAGIMGNLEGARGTRFPKKGEGRARYIKHFALKEKRLMRPPGTPSQDISPEDATSLVRHKTWWSQ